LRERNGQIAIEAHSGMFAGDGQFGSRHAEMERHFWPNGIDLYSAGEERGNSSRGGDGRWRQSTIDGEESVFPT
jgi:hypothetical protein